MTTKPNRKPFAKTAWAAWFKTEFQGRPTWFLAKFDTRMAARDFRVRFPCYPWSTVFRVIPGQPVPPPPWDDTTHTNNRTAARGIE